MKGAFWGGLLGCVTGLIVNSHQHTNEIKQLRIDLNEARQILAEVKKSLDPKGPIYIEPGIHEPK